jgi:hypothetical protein
MLPSPPPDCTLPRDLHDPGQGASVGLPSEMGDSDRSDDFIDGGLAALGIEADEIERAVIDAAHQLFWPGIVELLERDLGDVELERDPDLSSAPPPRREQAG